MKRKKSVNKAIKFVKMGNIKAAAKTIKPAINELIKMNYKTDDIVVGIMWTIPMIHERYISDGKNDDYMGKSETGFTSVVDNVKNWRILNHDSISSSEDCELYFKIIYNKLQSYVLSVEHILRTQWYLNKLGIKYFMTTYVDLFFNNKNLLKIYDFSKLTEYKRECYRLNILGYNVSAKSERFGEDTYYSLISYQSRNKLAGTGVLDVRTAMKLYRDAEIAIVNPTKDLYIKTAIGR